MIIKKGACQSALFYFLQEKKGDEKLRTFSFDYDGINSTSYSLMIGGISVSEEIPLGLSREVLSSGLNRYRSITTNMGTQWSDVLSFDVSFIKSPCEFPDDEGMIFTEYEVNEIAAWLTSPDYPTLLKMYDDDLESFTRYEYFGVFSDIQSQVWNGDIIGLNCTFHTNSPFAWTEEKKKQISSTQDDNQLQIVVNSAERKRELYPIVTISDSAGEVTITAVTDGNNSLTLTIPSNTEVNIDCQKYLIYDQDGNDIAFSDIGIADLTQFYWPKLYNGENIFTVTQGANVTFTWREPRKVGAY